MAQGVAGQRPRGQQVSPGQSTPDPPHLSRQLIIPSRGRCSRCAAPAPAFPGPAHPWWELQARCAPSSGGVSCSPPLFPPGLGADEGGESQVVISLGTLTVCPSCWIRRRWLGTCWRQTWMRTTAKTLLSPASAEAVAVPRGARQHHAGKTHRPWPGTPVFQPRTSLLGSALEAQILALLPTPML